MHSCVCIGYMQVEVKVQTLNNQNLKQFFIIKNFTYFIIYYYYLFNNFVLIIFNKIYITYESSSSRASHRNNTSII